MTMWLGTVGRLPDRSKLAAGSTHLRIAGDMLGERANAIRTFADSIGPGLWVDRAALETKRLLTDIANELSVGKAVLHQAGDALGSVAALVGAKAGRHAEIEAQLRDLQISPVLPVAEAGKQAEAARLLHERGSIERAVRSAMAHAAQVVDQAASKATRHQRTIGSVLGDIFKTIGGALGWAADQYWRYTKGFAEGTWELGESTVAMVVFVAKMSDVRRVLDPDGYARDRKAFEETTAAFWEALQKDPGGTLAKIGAAAIDADDLQKDPAHWFGKLVPGLLVTIISGGAGAVPKVSNVAAKGAKAADVAAALGKMSKAERLEVATTFLSRHESPLREQIRLTDGTVVPLPSGVNLGFTPESLDHVLHGQVEDGYWKGGHLHPGISNKSPFPDSWGPDKIIAETYDLVSDPTLEWRRLNDVAHPEDLVHKRGSFVTFRVEGWRDGIFLRVDVKPAGPGVWTSYPPESNWKPERLDGY